MVSWKQQLIKSLPSYTLQDDLLLFEGIKAQLISVNETIENKNDIDFIVHQDWWESRPKVLISRIESKFGRIQNRLFARKLKLEKLTLPESKKFINEHHLMGWGGGQVSYALVNSEEIIAVAAFSKGRKMKYENPPYVSAELIRFACKRGVHVVGGLDKLIQHYFRSKVVDEIITYVDKDWSDGSSFSQIGFELISESGPMQFEYDRALKTRVKLTDGTENPIIHSLGSLKMRLRRN